MSEKEPTYDTTQIHTHLRDLPGWYFEDGWLRRVYKTDGWPTTLMLVNAIGYIAEAAYHHPDLAVTALLDEAELTPKPALVDRRGSGAHHDLDLVRLRRSALSLRDGFAAISRAAMDEEPSLWLRARIGRIGRSMEQSMLAATNGSNAAHREPGERSAKCTARSSFGRISIDGGRGRSRVVSGSGPVSASARVAAAAISNCN